jgi:hypothetical protein
MSVASSMVLSPGASCGPFVVAEVGVACAGRDQERVVVDRAFVAERDPAGDRIEPTASPRMTRVFFDLRRIARSGWAMSPGDRAPVATW